MLRRTLFTVALLLAMTAVASAQTRKPTSPVPGDKSTWDLKAFNSYFVVTETNYDAKTKEVRWSLETKDAYRTSDLRRDLDRDRPFAFVFLDDEGKDLASIRLTSADFQGIPKERVMPKATPITLALEVPAVLGRTVKVELRRGAKK
jgi:hypothetical protein